MSRPDVNTEDGRAFYQRNGERIASMAATIASAGTPAYISIDIAVDILAEINRRATGVRS